MANRAVVPFSPLVFERHDFPVLALFEDFRGYFCSGDEWIPVIHVFSVGKQEYVAKCRGLAGFDVQKIDIEGITFRDAKLPATSSDDCVSHSFSGEKRAAHNSTDVQAWQTESTYLRCGPSRVAGDFSIQSFISLR
jgi:hypothetical protein